MWRATLLDLHDRIFRNCWNVFLFLSERSRSTRRRCQHGTLPSGASADRERAINIGSGIELATCWSAHDLSRCGSMTIETNSFETTLIWDYTHLRPHSFEITFIWDHIHLRSHSFGITFIWDHIHLGSHSFHAMLKWSCFDLLLITFLWSTFHFFAGDLKFCKVTLHLKLCKVTLCK